MAGYDPRVLADPGQRREDVQAQGEGLDQFLRWLTAAGPGLPGDIAELLTPETEGMVGDPALQTLAQMIGLRGLPTTEDIGVAIGGDPESYARLPGEILSPGPGELKGAADLAMAGLTGAMARRGSKLDSDLMEPRFPDEAGRIARRDAEQLRADEMYGLGERDPMIGYEPTAREAAFERASRAESEVRRAENLDQAKVQFARQNKAAGESDRQAYRRFNPDAEPGPLEASVQAKQVDDVQEIPSADTSINASKRPALFNKVDWEPGTVNVDIGGGRFDHHSDWLSDEHSVTNYVIDPYNRGADHNLDAAFTIDQRGGADTASIANVLNVIQEPGARAEVLQQAHDALKPGGEVRITVHQGDGTGQGRISKTKDGVPQSWQEHRKTADYLAEVQAVFPDAYRKGDVIYATKERPMFDLEAPPMEDPSLAREIDYYDPTLPRRRGVPAHMQALEENPEAFEQVLDLARRGTGGTGEAWYDTAQIRNKFVERFGEEEGARRMKLFMDMVASTSTGAKVPENLKIASHYYQQAIQGVDPSIPVKGSGYGHKMQKSHLQGAQQVVRGEGLDPQVQPKRYTFSENLQGNWAESTVDKHNVRAWGIASRDPAFLKTQVGKDISPDKPAWWDEKKYGEYPVVEIDGKRMLDPKFRPQDFLKANPDVPWDQLTPMWFKEAPTAAEYRAYNRLNQRLGEELGLSPAQAQAALWVGAADVTGLKSPPDKTFLELFHERIKTTAEKMEISEEEALNQFMDGKIRLSQIMGGQMPDMDGIRGLGDVLAQQEMFA